MKLIVGLGNPGRDYIYSRHNIGFSVIKSLAQLHKISLKKDTGILSLNGKAKLGRQNVILALPLTFMNLSGIAVKLLIRKYKIDLDSLLVVCDDLDLEFGRQKIRPSGSSGGHQGLQSIIESLGSPEFSRLRIGIGRPNTDINMAEYVLSPFSVREKEQVKDVIENAIQCCLTWMTKDIIIAMNIFNKRSK